MRLGRKVLDLCDAKLALECAVRAVPPDTPIPKHASDSRLQWLGAAHALCGQALAQMLDPVRDLGLI